MMNRDIMVNHAINALNKAYDKHGKDQWGRHEFYAILKEEVDEVWDIIKADGPTNDLITEMSHVMAMILRYYETGNRYSKDL